MVESSSMMASSPEEMAAMSTTMMPTDCPLSCVAKSFKEQVILRDPEVVTATRVFQAIFYQFLLIFGVSLNVMVIVLVAKFKRLQNLSFAVAIQVAVLNLILSTTLGISVVPSAISNHWVFGEHMCQIVGVVILSGSIMRTLLMFIFVIDRFLSVFLPFFYPRYKVKSITALIVTSWVFSIAIGITAFALDCYRFSTRSWHCNAYNDCSGACNSFVSTLYGAVAGPSTIIPMLMYLALYIKARRLKKATSASTESVVHTYQVDEWRATVTFFLLLITVFALTLPNLAVFFAIDYIYEDTNDIPPTMHILSILSICVISLLVVTDPIVIMRNRDVRDILNGLKKAFIKRWCPSFQDDSEMGSEE